jgi:hypothetical protein
MRNKQYEYVADVKAKSVSMQGKREKCFTKISECAEISESSCCFENNIPHY